MRQACLLKVISREEFKECDTVSTQQTDCGGDGKGEILERKLCCQQVPLKHEQSKNLLTYHWETDFTTLLEDYLQHCTL